MPKMRNQIKYGDVTKQTCFKPTINYKATTAWNKQLYSVSPTIVN